MNRSRLNVRPLLITGAIAVLAVAAVAAPPIIGSCQPLAVAPGKTVELTLNGQNLLNPRVLWTSFASRTEFVAPHDDNSNNGVALRCRITVPREEQVGVGALRLATAEGVSNPVLVMVDDLNSAAESADNRDAAHALPLQWPIAVDGVCDAVQEDWFTFHAEAGEQLSFETVSQRIGSQLDPTLRLLTAGGMEIAHVDDSPGVGGDCRFSHLFEASGDYLLSIRDVRHLGGGDFRYRMRIGSFPPVTAAYPAGGRSGEVATLELAGQGEATSLLHVSIPHADNEPKLAPISIPSSDYGGSGWFQIETNSGAETLEQEPNDQVDAATAAQIPGAINGRLGKHGDRDQFKFHAVAGQRIHCVGRSREFGSPCDLYLSLHKADGTQLAVARQEPQPVLETEIAEAGDYVLLVENLLDGGGPDHVYRIDVSDAYGGFALNTEFLQYTASQAGTAVVKVVAQRPTYAGPIELDVEGLGSGVQLNGHIFEGPETLLKITVPADLAAGEFRHAKIVGRAKIGEETVKVLANNRGLLRAMFPNTIAFPTILESAVAIGVGPPFPPFFDLAIANEVIYFPQLVGATTFEVAIKRINEAFADPVELAVEGLPPGVAAEISPVKDGRNAMTVSLKGPVDLAEGTEFPIRIVGTGRFQEQTRQVTVDQLKLRVVKPLVVSLAMKGPIACGGIEQAEIRVQRFGNEPQPVDIRFTDGPAGLAAPISTTIPSNDSLVTAPIRASDDAAPGTFPTLILTATTRVQGQEVSVRSEPATVEIQGKSADTSEGAPP